MDDAKLIKNMSKTVARIVADRLGEDLVDPGLYEDLGVEMADFAAGLRNRGMRLIVDFRFYRFTDEAGEAYGFDAPAPGLCGGEPEVMGAEIIVEPGEFDEQPRGAEDE